MKSYPDCQSFRRNQEIIKHVRGIYNYRYIEGEVYSISILYLNPYRFTIIHCQKEKENHYKKQNKQTVRIQQNSVTKVEML